MPDRFDRRHNARSRTEGFRSEARKDRDKILYSIEFQRLSGVTQVVSPTERFPVHNRLTHSLKVSQVGRSIAEKLLHDSTGNDLLTHYLDPDVVEAACLAHDIGHPPFGHNTERELNDLVWNSAIPVKEREGFEGNAQSFRVVTKLSVSRHRQAFSGLNLTRATLAAILKYPQPQHGPTGERNAKWGYYASEVEDFTYAAELLRPESPPSRTIEADIMDCADDITYGVHDIEDFFRIGILPTEVFDSDSGERARFCEHLQRESGRSRDDIEAGLAPLGLLFDRYQGREVDIAQLSEFRSASIDRLISALRVAWGNDSPYLDIPNDTQIEISVLKGLTRQYVIQRASVQAQRFGQRRMVRMLYEIFVAAAISRRDPSDQLQIFPALFRDRILALDQPSDHLQQVKRYVADFIASMTEPQLLDTFAKLTGQTQGSAFEPTA